MKKYQSISIVNCMLEKKLTVQAAKFSKSAEEAINAAGGKAEVI